MACLEFLFESLDRSEDLPNTTPFVLVLGLPREDIEALKNIDDVVNSAPFYLETSRTLVQSNHGVLFVTV